MKDFRIVLLCLLTLITTACNQTTNHKYDGSYSMDIQLFGMSNSKEDLIINGNKIKYLDEVWNCKQYDDRVDVENGKMIFTYVDGDLVVNAPTIGKVHYVRISENSDLTQNN